MTRSETGGLRELARAGFSGLGAAEAALSELAQLGVASREDVLAFGLAADPDSALSDLVQLARRDPAAIRALNSGAQARLWRLLGASHGLGSFLVRHPEQLEVFAERPTLPTARQMREHLLGALDAFVAGRGAAEQEARNALRVAYRRELLRIAIVDVEASDPAAILDEVAAALADAASAALEAALTIARAKAARNLGAEEVEATQLAIIGMGKAGARELNYISDVDVIFVAGTSDEELVSEGRAVEIATTLARETMHAIADFETEPPLWEVDANLRPEGKQGALVRSLASHTAYYDRWAKNWEFQALLKARPLAGDAELGEQYITALHDKVWTSAGRDDFVESVQRMRERVTEHINPDDVPYQLKLGPGGLRDIEFTVQLLQLVHGRTDPSVRTRGTLESLQALVDAGYIGRDDAAAFAQDYRMLRVLEHRMQLRGMTRTHLLPRDDDGVRILARSVGYADRAPEALQEWDRLRREVRNIHTRLFYRPLLAAVASIPDAERLLSPEQARDRLAAIGFASPKAALDHIAALTSGLSRKATVQRGLLPVMLHWMAEGHDPDYALLAFRRISDRLGDTPWFLRMLRDSSGAAERLTALLSSSRYVGELMEWIPESVAWLDDPPSLTLRDRDSLLSEMNVTVARQDSLTSAARAVRTIRRRELLRTAMAGVLGTATIDEVAASLTAITEASIQGLLAAVRKAVVAPEDLDTFEFAIIGMGRFGGAELGFGSDADVMFVYDAGGIEAATAQKYASEIVSLLREHLADARVPFELDADLRPEGRQGPLVRSLEAYEKYYSRWSVSWESQALLRARGVAGDAALIERFTALADRLRYPAVADEDDLREVKRIKARVEGERLPQGIDPKRHLKLGPGSLSDVEWLVQLLQLENAHNHPALQTVSTLGALEAAVTAGLVTGADAEVLSRAWRLASRLRSANTLLTGKDINVLPTDLHALDGLARLLGYPDRSAIALQDDYGRAARQSRRVFERLFYGE